MVFHEILWDSLTSPTFPLLLSTFPHIYLLFPTHTLFFPTISCVFPHVSLILFSQNSVLFAGNNVETTQLYIRVRHPRGTLELIVPDHLVEFFSCLGYRVLWFSSRNTEFLLILFLLPVVFPCAGGETLWFLRS